MALMSTIDEECSIQDVRNCPAEHLFINDEVFLDLKVSCGIRWSPRWGEKDMDPRRGSDKLCVDLLAAIYEVA